MTKYKNQNWSIELADGWVGELEEDIHIIYHPNGVGALQISAFIKDSPITNEDLIENTGLDDEGISHLNKNKWGQFEGYELNYSDGENFLRKWWLVKGNTFLLLTYNCETQDKDQELNDINRMVSSLNE